MGSIQPPQQDTPMSAIIIINGYPGVGKHTIAKGLSRNLPEAKVFDNHNLDLAASSLFDWHRQTKQHGELRKSLRRTVLSSLPTRASSPATPTSPLPIYIFTDTLLSSPVGLATLKEYLTPGIPVVHIILSATTDANVSRITGDSSRGARGKLTDEGTLREIRMEEEVARLLTRPGVSVGGLAGEYEIETCQMDAAMVAGVVHEYVLEALRGAGVWVTMARKGNGGSIQTF